MLIIIAVLNLLATGGVVWLVWHRTKPVPHYERSAYEAPRATEDKKPDHYTIQFVDRKGSHILYDGTDSNKAYDAWVKMDANPYQYPGRHQRIVNGRCLIDRHYSEVPV